MRCYIKNRTKGRPRAFDRDLALHKALKIFWQQGYEPASIADLCKAMEINPPSLYACFGNKTDLFIEAVNYYERTYWDEPSKRFLQEPDIHKAVKDFFKTAGQILQSPEMPCGCMVVLATINISENATEVISAIRKLRLATKEMFAKRIVQAIENGQLPTETDVQALSGALNTMLEGLSIQARDGLSATELQDIAALAVRLLPKHPPEKIS